MNKHKGDLNGNWATRTIRGGVLGLIISVMIFTILYALHKYPIQDSVESTYVLVLMAVTLSGTVVGMVMGAFRDKI